MTTPAANSAPTPTRLPRISLVTPSFNQGQFLEATLRSVLEQDYPDLEYVVVDGGSTDGSVEILRRYSQRLSSWVSEPDRGHAHALNKGFARSTGEVMGWINSDDILLPGSLLLVGTLFARFPEMEWLTSPGAMTEPDGKIVGIYPRTPWTRARFLTTRDHWIQQESTFWRRGLWERAGAELQESLLACDHELWARFFRHARLFQTPGLIGAFRFRPDQLSVRQRERYVTETLATLEREAALADPLPLADAEAATLSELVFDPARLSFERRDTRALPSDIEPELVTVDAELASVLSVTEIRLPPWGAESGFAIRDLLPALITRRRGLPTFVWLGCGDAEGVLLRLRSTESRTVELQLAVSPGPARGGDILRTLSCQLRASDGSEQRGDFTFDSEESLAWQFELVPGRHDLTLSIREQQIAGLPGADTRPLLAAIADLRLAASSRSLTQPPERLRHEVRRLFVLVSEREREYERLRAEVDDLRQSLAASESDRAARLGVIHQLQAESAERIEATRQLTAAREELRAHAARLEAALAEREAESAGSGAAAERLAVDRQALLAYVARLEIALADERRERERWLSVLPVLRLRLPAASAVARGLRALRNRFAGRGPASDDDAR